MRYLTKIPVTSFSHLAVVFAAGTLAVTGVMLAPKPTQAQTTCAPLSIVGSNQTEIEKKVSPPSFLFTQTNWNTDFVVPSESRFDRFIARVTSFEGSTYNIDVNLKYSDDTVDQAYSARQENLAVNAPREITVYPRVGAQPYQINMFIGGAEADENVYTVSVRGCRN